MPRRAAIVLILAATQLGAGPARARDDGPVAPRAPDRFLRAGDATAAQPADPWWLAVQDPQLTALIERGLAHSPSIAASAARIQQARARLAGSRAAALPSVSASLAYLHANLPDGVLGNAGGTADLFNAGFDAQWEIDLWGGRHAAVRRSVAQAEAVAAQGDAVRASLAAEIARAYVSLCARRAALGLLDARLQLESRRAALAAQRVAAGAAPRQTVELAEAQLARTRSEVAGLTADAQALEAMLALLVGEAPSGLGEVTTGAVPLPPARVDIGDPAAMLQRRPDVRAAERQVTAARSQIAVARARRFPSISFLGLLGVGGSSADDLFDPQRLASLALPTLRWSFLDFGRTAAATRAARAEADAAAADYQQTVLAALQDAEAALARYGGARIAYGEAEAAASRLAARSALDDQRAEAGAISRDQAFATRGERLDSAIAAINARAAMTLDYIALSKSLGLGWGS